jgi:hypothetical protein
VVKRNLLPQGRRFCHSTLLLGCIEIRHLVLIVIGILTVCLDRLSVACSADADSLPSANIFYITRPAPGCLDVQDKAIELRIVTTRARHPEVGGELTAVEFEQVFYAILAEIEIECAAVGTSNGGGSEDISVEELG